MEDLGAKIAEEGEGSMSQRVKPARAAYTCIQRLASRAQWRVDSVERGAMLVGGKLLLKLSTLITPDPCL